MASGRLSEWIDIPEADPFTGGYTKYKYLGYQIFNGVTMENYINRLNSPISSPLDYSGIVPWYSDFFQAIMNKLESVANTPFNPTPDTWSDPSAEIVTWSWKLIVNPPNSVFQLGMNEGADIWGFAFTNFQQLRLKIWEGISSAGVPFGESIEAVISATNAFNIVTEMYKSI